MAAPSYTDRVLATRVRTLALEEVEKALLKKKGKLYEAVLIKLAGTVLPRLNELSGVDGKDLIVQITAESAKRYDITSKSIGSGEGQA